MAVTYVAVNAAAGQSAGTTNTASTVAITPTLPTGTASGDRVFVFEEHNCASGSATSPTSWTPLYKDIAAGSGTPGAGTGTRYISCHYRDYDGVWTMPSYALASVAQNTHHVSAVTVRHGAGETFDAPTYSALGDYWGAPGTAFSGTTTAFATRTGALLMAQVVTNDSVTSTLPGITGTNGLVVANVTERCDGGSASGNDVSGKLHTANVTTEASPAGTLTHTLTLNSNSEGSVRFVQQAIAPIGTSAVALAKTGLAFGGAVAPTGTAVVALRSSTLDAAGAQPYSGTSAVGLKKVAASVPARMEPAGAVAAVLAKTTVALAGKLAESGTVAATVKKLAVSLAGREHPRGTVAEVLATLKESLAGQSVSSEDTGTVAASLAKTAESLTGKQVESGAISASLMTAVGSLAGKLRESGTAAAVLRKPAASLVGKLAEAGTVAATPRKIVTRLLGALVESGSLTAALTKPAEALTGRLVELGRVVVALQPATESVGAGISPHVPTADIGSVVVSDAGPAVILADEDVQLVNVGPAMDITNIGASMTVADVP